MKKFNLILVIFLLLISRIYSSTGTSGGKTLSIPIGTRAIGLGEAYCGYINDVNSVYWNPAGTANMKSLSISGMYSIWIDDIKISNITIGLPINFFKLYTGFGFTLLNTGDNIPLIKQDAYQNPIETGEKFGCMDMTFLIFGAKKINQNIFTGVNLKLLYSKIEKEKAVAVVMDIGGIYTDLLNNLNFGITIQNLGPKIKYVKEGDMPPINFKSGIFYSFKDLIRSNFIRPVIGFDVNKGIDAPVSFNLGSEIKMMNLFSVRVGYKIKKNENNIRIGGGLNFKLKKYKLNLNYAFAPYFEIGNTHRMELQFFK